MVNEGLLLEVGKRNESDESKTENPAHTMEPVGAAGCIGVSEGGVENRREANREEDGLEIA